MKAELPPLKHAWQGCICQGLASEFLRADVQDHFRLLQKEIGYRHIRFHGSFHDDLGVVERSKAGELIFNWVLLDKVYDFIVDAGFDPIVELNPMPQVMASGGQTMFDYKMNVTPPKKMEEWEALVRASTLHFIERYGINRVRKWMFEVWNEPNLNGQFWTGTQLEYFELYAASARAVKEVCSELPIGGPSSAGGEWCLPLLEWCKEKKVPVDFISFHNYPMGEYGKYPKREGSPHAAGMAFSDEFRETKEKLTAAGYADMPIIVTEWNAQHCDENGKTKWVGCEDNVRLFSAAAVLHLNYHTEPYVDVFGYWTGSDVLQEAELLNRRFGAHNQYYGLVDLNGDPKPAFHAFKFLSRLQGPRYDLDLGAKPELAYGLVSDETSSTRALFWNFHMPEFETEHWRASFKLPVPAALKESKTVRLTTARLVKGQGSAFELWESMGRPTSQTRVEDEALKAATHPFYRIYLLPIAEDGTVELSFDLGRNEVLFAELSDGKTTGQVDFTQQLAELNKALDYPGAV